MRNPKALREKQPGTVLKDFVLSALPHIRARKLPVPDCTELACPALGCGSYGCVFKTDQPGIVVKATDAKLEARMWNVVKYSYDVPELGNISNGFPSVGHVMELKNEEWGWPRYLIWREEVDPDWESYFPAEEAQKIGRAIWPFRSDNKSAREYSMDVEDLTKGPLALKFAAVALSVLFTELKICLYDIHAYNLSVPLREAKNREPQLVIHDAFPFEPFEAASYRFKNNELFYTLPMESVDLEQA